MELKVVETPVVVQVTEMKKAITLTLTYEEAADLRAVFGHIGGNHPGKVLTEKLYWEFGRMGIAATAHKRDESHLALYIYKADE